MRHSRTFYAIRRVARLVVASALLLCIVGFPTMAIYTVMTHWAEALPVLLMLSAAVVILMIWAFIDSLGRANRIVDDGVKGDA